MKIQLGHSLADPQPVRIEFYDEKARRVYIAGAFNQWQPKASPLLGLGHGRWVRVLFLSPGRHEFRFVVINA